MRKPTLHLNGSGKGHLAEAYEAAYKALYQAEQAVQNAAPNARDYYPQGDSAFREAQREHTERLLALVRVRKEILELLEHCS